MKKYVIIMVLFLGLTFVRAIFAEDIQTGDQAVETHTVNINNNGSITSHTETIINGKKEIIDTTALGQIKVSPTISPFSISVSSLLSPTKKPIHKNMAFNLFESISNFIKRIFRNL